MYDVIIIGSGASGAFLNHLLNGKNVLVLESTSTSLNKVKISGGSKANFTNLIDDTDFINAIPVNNKILYSLLKSFNTYDIYNYFIDKGLETNIIDNTKVFCKNSSVDLINILLNKNNIKYNETVIDILGNTVITNKNEYKANKIVIATGGMSYPKTGSKGFIFDFCKKHNLSYTKPYPAEASINLYDETSVISGISFQDVIIKNETNSFRDNLLFTHKGISGFSTLKLSEYVYLNNSKKVYIDFLPDTSNEELLEKFSNFLKTKELKTLLKEFFPSKFADFFLKKISIDGKKTINQLNIHEINIITNSIKNFELKVKSVQNVTEAFVTGGGISFKEINPKDLSLTSKPNIHVLGEALDLHGPIGGFNISIAFITAYRVFEKLK